MTLNVLSQKSLSRAVSVESFIDDLTVKAKIIFESLDTEHKGFLEAGQLATACGLDSSEVDLHDILLQMDCDGDGLINFNDFSKSFQKNVRRRNFYRETDFMCPKSLSQMNLSHSSTNSDFGNMNSSPVKPVCTQASTNSENSDFDGSVFQVNSKLQKRASIFRRIRARQNQRLKCQIRRQVSSRSTSLLDLNEGMDNLQCSDKIEELGRSLAKENECLQQLFEQVMADVFAEIRRLREENKTMETTVDTERRKHREEIARLAEELDLQVVEAESTARRQEREVVVKELTKKLQAKDLLISKLTEALESSDEPFTALSYCDGLSESLSTSKRITTEDMESIRDKLFVLRWQKSSAEADMKELKAQLAMAKSEITSLRHRHDTKASELAVHHSAIKELLYEKKKLSTETSILKEMNRRLYDVNDDLCAALETTPSIPNRHMNLAEVENTEDVNSLLMSDYEISSRAISSLNFRPSYLGNKLCLITNNAREKAEVQPPVYAQTPMDRNTPYSSPSDDENKTSDSGLCSLRDVAEKKMSPQMASSDASKTVEWTQTRIAANTLPVREQDTFHDPVSTATQPSLENVSNRRCSSNTSTYSHVTSIPYSDSDHVDDADDIEAPNSKTTRRIRSLSRAYFSGNRTSSIPSNSVLNKHCLVGTSRRPIIPQSNAFEAKPKLTGPEMKQTFRIMLAGDSSVGKSSFILRLCCDTFSLQTASTIGVDMKQKTISVDGSTTILQLWDTAGQERFRSISASFYRKADAILLLYDCTYETSFVNVRNWINIIREQANANIPIILVGNKIDARAAVNKSGVRTITYTDGRRLAQECDATFVETSARDGSNIELCAHQLGRMLIMREAIAESGSLLKLDQVPAKPKLSSRCCKV